VAEAVAALKHGRLVVLPTETVYGVAASAGSAEGVAALRKLKRGRDDRAFTVHIADADDARHYADLDGMPGVKRLVGKVFPGPVAVVLPVPLEVADTKVRRLGLPGEAADRIYQNGAVALRCPDHAAAVALLRRCADPVVAAAATVGKQRPPHTAEQAARNLADVADEVELVLDAGPCRYTTGSTVVRAEGGGLVPRVTVEREGVIETRVIDRLARWTMLLVCSGNTCRSPMAEGIAKRLIAESKGLREDELRAAGIEVVSAGVSTFGGSAASPEGVAAAAERGIDISHHRSQPLNLALIHQADVIYTMTENHRLAVLDIDPMAADKVQRLDRQRDIEDPIGTGGDAYRRVRDWLADLLAERLQEAGV